MTVKEIKKELKKYGVTPKRNLSKDELLRLLNEAKTIDLDNTPEKPQTPNKTTPVDYKQSIIDKVESLKDDIYLWSKQNEGVGFRAKSASKQLTKVLEICKFQ